MGGEVREEVAPQAAPARAAAASLPVWSACTVQRGRVAEGGGRGGAVGRELIFFLCFSCPYDALSPYDTATAPSVGCSVVRNDCFSIERRVGTADTPCCPSN